MISLKTDSLSYNNITLRLKLIKKQTNRDHRFKSFFIIMDQVKVKKKNAQVVFLNRHGI